jgi:hypothetical protein
MKKAIAKVGRGTDSPDSINQALKKAEKLVSVFSGKHNSCRSASRPPAHPHMLRHERKFKRQSQRANYKSIAAGRNGAKFKNFVRGLSYLEIPRRPRLSLRHGGDLSSTSSDD